MENNLQNNVMQLEGKIIGELSFSHELFDEKFYTFPLSVARLSEKSDVIIITISEKLLQEVNFEINEMVLVTGQIRSYNKFNNGRNRLILTAFARNIAPLVEKSEDPNQVIIEGFVCKKPVFRTTPFGREISDILIAVNRAYNKSDYIPVIAWGRNARFSKSFEIGEKIKITGRFQSRQYEKTINDNEKIKMVAYEVSVSKLDKIEEVKESNEIETINQNEVTNLVKEKEEVFA